MKHFYKALITLLTITCNAQYYQSKILFANGQSKEGYTELPTNSLFDSSIKFQADKNGKAEKIKNDEIEKIVYYTDNGKEYHIERTAIRQFIGKRENTTKKKAWIHVRFSTPEIIFYDQAEKYIINKHGDFISSTIDYSGTWADIALLFKRPGEVVPTILGSLSNGAIIINKERTFRTTAILYFKGEESIIKRIESKEFKSEDMLELAKAYIEHKRE